MMRVSNRFSILLILSAAGGWFAGPALGAPPLSPSAEQPFLDSNHAAMDRMMAAMSITPSGDVDVDFAAMMIPHHQGAIEMAQAELLHGHNEQLRRIAQEIIVEQQQEIVAMRLALSQVPPPSAPSTDQPKLPAMPMMNMQKATP